MMFLLSLLFNPLGLLSNWLPAFYLAAWPIIIQTLGRETLLTNAIVLILFILTCDISRQFMLRLIGFDLISLPLGIALLLSLATSKGAILLSILKPIFSSTLTLIEPAFLLIEAYIFIDTIRGLNKWISEQSNLRDEESRDFSSWDPPLSRTSIVARIAVILISILSYIGVYLIIQESRSLLAAVTNDDTMIPINFHHSIAALVTLQLIALSATIYKEEGILSESSNIALIASVPIFIASWSYYHLMKENSTTNSSVWGSFNLFSIFGGSNGDDDSSNNDGFPYFQHRRSFDGLDFHRDRPSRDDLNTAASIDLRAFEGVLRRMGLLDSVTLQLLSPILRQLIMIINSILGLSMHKLAKYYFGPDFWLLLFGRLLCVSWWSLMVLRRNSNNNNNDHQNQPGYSDIHGFTNQQHSGRSSRNILPNWLPLSGKTLIKILLVLAYAQMIIQQMDNREHLKDHVNLLTTDQAKNVKDSAACCGGGAEAQEAEVAANKASSGDVSAWFNCMWTSAKACSQTVSTINLNKRSVMSILGEFFKQIFNNFLSSLDFLYKVALNLDSLLWVWCARWRSPIVQRLSQSILIQVYYISSVLFVYE